ncbi:MAG: superoxide dismutase family protein [Candidatus Omnitrophica bacterium]|nr:superoxide dismutase family protein [Candidatus Omnitrophota bacterium]
MKRVIAVVGCVLFGVPWAWAESGKAVIQATAEGSSVSGDAALTETPDGLKMTVRVSNVPPGKHGLHIHQFGNCADQGNAAGGHYNPHGVAHGFLPSDGFAGAHAGDFGNIEVGADGTGMLELTLPDLRLGGASNTVGGRAIVLHEKEDDFGQPTGNAGGRIGCGVITITGS